MFCPDLWLSYRSYSGVIFPYFRHSHQYSICVLPGPCTGGWGFDFKIHWKQLSPSLSSPILFRSPLATHTHAAWARSPVWPQGPWSRERCHLTEPPSTSLRWPQDIILSLITVGGKKGLKHVQGNQRSLMIALRDRMHCDYCGKTQT